MASIDYSRQQGLGLKVPASATIVGVGGVGSWVATFLTLSGVRKLYLYDPDALEPTNFNRLPLVPGSGGQNKARALRDWLISLRPEAIVLANAIAANEVVLVKTNILFDCTDDFKVREPLFNWAQENRVRYIRAGYDGGDHLTVTETLPWQVGQPLGRYEIVPSWVVPCVLVSALAVYSALRPATNHHSISTDISTWIEAARNLNAQPGDQRRSSGGL